jgi:deoxyribodipyrimidine photo-lyase
MHCLDRFPFPDVRRLPKRMDSKLHIVWFKRDLRVADHAPLLHAAAQGPVLPLFVFEPGFWKLPDADLHHFQFAVESLNELHGALSELGGRLCVRTGEMTSILHSLSERFAIAAVYSHQETGNDWTYQRDRRVATWLNAHGIPWHEHRQSGVIRKLADRNGWAERWQRFMSEPIAPAPSQIQVPPEIPSEGFPSPTDLGLDPSVPTSTAVQRGGASEATRLLDSFLKHRGRSYRTAMSSPSSAESACSRLSPYIAWGCISVRQIYRAVRRELQPQDGPSLSRDASDRQRMASLRSFQSRLSWHCHFMQKLEDEPRIEFENMCRAYDGLREDAFDEERFERWCSGQTGYPMIDACMRSLNHTRWINFRMRAMLVSFASYHLWLHWRRPALFLAKQFLDYEPGIHYPQIQMQSGVTGINTVRIYSPTKQAHDQDPEGTFIRKWVPELANVPAPFVWEPWRISLDDQDRWGCQLDRDYPRPIVVHEEAVREAKRRIYEIRKTDEARLEAEQVVRKHGSRKRRDPMPRQNPKPQTPFFPGMDDGNE